MDETLIDLRFKTLEESIRMVLKDVDIRLKQLELRIRKLQQRVMKNEDSNLVD